MRVITAAQTCAIGSLQLERGGTLHDVHVACSSYGDPAAPAVLVLGGISAGRHLLPTGDNAAAGWWPGVIGSGCALDPDALRLIGVDYVGGRGASSQPQRGSTWPAFTTRDQAAAIVAALEQLGVDRLHAVVGASYGGMAALALAAYFPERTDRIVIIGAAHRTQPHATAVRSVQRRAVRLGLDSGRPHDGIAVARALAVTTYRTADEFAARFTGAPHANGRGVEFPVDSWLDHHAQQYAHSFSAESFLTISESLDLHDVDVSGVRAHCTIACVDSDTLVPPTDARALAAALGDRASLVSIASPYGHDAFLKEPDAVGTIIAAALTGTRPVAGSGGSAGAPPPRAPDGTPVTRYAGRRTANTGAAATCAVRAGVGADAQHGAVMPPIHLSSTFSFAGYGEKRRYDYTRSGNPTRDVLASAIADLEHAAAAIVTPTGMAAVNVTLQLLQPGDLLIAAHDGYGGTWRLLRALTRKRAFDVLFVDLTTARAADIIRTRRPRMVWLETPSNPLLRITDIAAVAAAAHEAGALCVADNTFLSPALQTPLDLGADVVVHSTTKYLNGHSDVVGGAVAAADAAVAEEIGWWANCTGATGSPFDSYLTLRGLRTLHARMRSHEENAAAIVDLLHRHEAVRAVHYPGLSLHPGHEIARRQQRGFGGMVSFELAAGAAAVPRLLAQLDCFTLAESLGGVESLIAHPATMTHASMDDAARLAAGISNSLLRLSVGIEAPEDLIADLQRGLDAAAAADG